MKFTGNNLNVAEKHPSNDSEGEGEGEERRLWYIVKEPIHLA
jgi:hypothetical protein